MRQPPVGWQRLRRARVPLADEREDEAEQREGFDERKAEKHGRAQLASGLRLTGDALKRLRDELTERQRRADRRQAVADDVEVPLKGDCGKDSHYGCAPFSLVSARVPGPQRGTQQ